MIRRSTLFILFSLTGFTTIASASLAGATVEQELGTPSAVDPTANPTWLIAQQTPSTTPPTQPNPATQRDPFSINPANSTNTGTAVPNITNPQTRPTADALNPSQTAESVRTLQQQLQQRGYYDGPIDGLYGSGTKRAVESFQQDTGISDSGRANIPTIDRLTPGGPTAQTNAQTDGNAAEGAAETAPDSPASDREPGAAGDSAPVAEPSESEPSDAEASPTAGDAEPSWQRWLWPGLALAAALGSFGIGFLVFNRSKEGDLILDGDSPWGTVSPDLQPKASPGVPATRHSQTNGAAAAQPSNPATAAAANGAAYGSPARGASSANGTTPANRANNGTGAISPVMEPQGAAVTTRLPKVNILDELVEDLRVPDPTRRRKAIWELGQRGNSTAIQPLVNAMVAADSKEKSLILAALSEIGIRSLKPMNRALAIALQDDNPEVRKNAIRDLTRIYDLVAQISQMLGHATEDEDPEVRQTANWALEQLGRIRKPPEMRGSLPPLDTKALGSQKQSAELLPGDRSN